MNLYSRPSNQIRFGGKLYKANLSFNIVLLILKLIKDNRISHLEKYNTMVRLLEPDPIPEDPIGFCNEMLKNHIYKTSGKAAPTKEPSYDFILDAEYIYSSFLQDYNIDLHDQINKMHWETFKALFTSLSEKTTIKKIMNIRTTKIPPRNKHNGEQIKELQRLKLHYSLAHKRDPEEQRKHFEDKIIKWMEDVQKR